MLVAIAYLHVVLIPLNRTSVPILSGLGGKYKDFNWNIQGFNKVALQATLYTDLTDETDVFPFFYVRFRDFRVLRVGKGIFVNRLC
jgi:hypothetical protein